MKNWKSNLALVVFCVAVGIVPVLDTALWTDVVASGPDRDPPAVMVHRSETADAGAPLTVSAQVTDPAGIGRVVLWVRGEWDDEFRQVPMEQVGEDQVQAELAPWPEQGSEVAYYIEARDAEGNGPSYAGAPRTPYVIRIKGALPPQPEQAGTNWALWITLAAGLVVLVGGYPLYKLYSRFSQDRRHAQLNAELDRLTGKAPEPKPAAKAPTADKFQERRKKPRIPSDPEEQAFWIGLLTPLRDMGTYDREYAIQNMSARPHHHPKLGKRFFDVGTLNQHFQWVERGEVQLTKEMVKAAAQPAEPREATPPESS